MKAMIWSGVMLVVAGGAGTAHADDPAVVADQPAATCTYRAEPSTAAGPIVKSEVTLMAVVPAAGGDVRRDTLIAFDVEYRIKDFVGGPVLPDAAVQDGG